MFAVGDVTSRSNDAELIAQAARERRVLITEDKDFGWLVYVSHADSAGVILIRFPGNARRALAPAVIQLVQEHGESLIRAFVVMQPGVIRISRRPSA